MATIQGTGGNVTIGGFGGKMRSWSADIVIDTVETTGFSDAGMRTNEPVCASVRGSASAVGQYNGAGTAPMPSVASLPSLSTATSAIVLTAIDEATDSTLSFNAVVSNVKESRRFDGALEITFDFESDGAVAIAGTSWNA